MARDEEFTAFVIARGSRLRRTAFLMTGNWHEAEDLTQSALTRLYVAWPARPGGKGGRLRADRPGPHHR
jgi:DNA-directed RNA polymerase specialized sigma24 family protein